MTARKPGSTRMIRGELARLGLDGKHPFYQAWANMKTRCDNPESTQYMWYGARGITYCEAWKIFRNFYTDMIPEWSPGLVLDRIDNDLPYEKDNCRWVSHAISMQNRRSNVVDAAVVSQIRLLHKTGKYTQAQIAERFGVTQSVVSNIVTYQTWTNYSG